MEKSEDWLKYLDATIPAMKELIADNSYSTEEAESDITNAFEEIENATEDIVFCHDYLINLISEVDGYRDEFEDCIQFLENFPSPKDFKDYLSSEN